jgi:putative DNA primase/helicase
MTRPLWLIEGDPDQIRGFLPDIEISTLECPASVFANRETCIWRHSTDTDQKRALKAAGRLMGNPSPPASLHLISAPDGWNIAESVLRDPSLWDQDSLRGFAAKYGKQVTQAQAPAKRAHNPPAEQQPGYILWEQLGLAKNDKGPYPTEANALRIIAAHTEYAGRIWLDEFAQRLMIDTDDGPVQFSRTHALQVLVWMQETLQLPKMPLSAVERAATLVGERNKRHELRKWLQDLIWDGHERLALMLADGWGAEETPYTMAVGRCWLIGMVARIFSPGEKMDTLPVFEGRQGILKSSSLQALVPDKKYFLSSNIDPIRNQKDFLSSLQGKWLIEFAEVNRYLSRESHADDMKALISIEVDTYRVPYGATTMDYPRQCVFAGTLNSREWNADQTGGRRFWPVECGEINLDYITANREQLFAEAVHRYRKGESWWDVPRGTAEEQQEQRRIKDEWEGLIERYITEGVDRTMPGPAQWYPRVSPLETLTVMDILTNCLGVPEGRCDRSLQMRVSNCLKALDWEKFRSNVAGTRQNKYRRVFRR